MAEFTFRDDDAIHTVMLCSQSSRSA